MDLFDLTCSVAAVIDGTGVLGGAICHGLGRAGATIAVMGRSAACGEARVSALEAEGIRAAFVEVEGPTPTPSRPPGRGRGAPGAGERPRQRPGREQLDAFLDIGLDEWHRIIDPDPIPSLLPKSTH
jgi:hypothetical protein